MALVAITLKIMPTSPEVDMAELRKKVEAKVKELCAILHDVKEEPIAFGLIALIVIIGWKEEQSPDIVETELAKVENVNSVQVTDVRRAFG